MTESPLVAATTSVLLVIVVAVASYLIYLGLVFPRDAVPDRTPSAALDGSLDGGGKRPAALAGASALNPKSLVLFVAFLPQFVRPPCRNPLALQLAVLGLV